MNRTKNKYVYILTALILLCLGMFVFKPLTASAAETLSIEDGNITITDSGSYIITGSTTSNKIVVQGGTPTITLQDVTINLSSGCPIEIASGTCTLIIKGSNTLQAGQECAGINVPSGSKIIIKGYNSDNSDKLEVTSGGPSDKGGAGIGGNKSQACGNIVIESGTVKASAGHSGGAGIGSGCGGAFGNVTINGGIVEANGSYNGAGIGGGLRSPNGGTITITGGTVTAKGGYGAAGIGGGNYNTVDTINISGGVISASGGSHAQAIGASKNAAATDDVEIEDCVIIQNGSASIDISIGSVLIESDGFTIGDGAKVSYTGNYSITGTSTSNSITVSGNNVNVTVKDLVISGGAPIYVKSGSCNLTIDGTNKLSGGAGQPGIRVEGGASITIGGASGTLEAIGGNNAAGIGAADNTISGNITINSGQITATGGSNATGIGAGNGGKLGGNISITGGTVEATGGWRSAGIGGNGGTGGSVTITGNSTVVTAVGGEDAAGIGGGLYGNGCNTIINGGIVTATGKGGGAGIGGGAGGGNGGAITITNGTVTAKANGVGAGIGGGSGGSGGTTIISGGTVIAASNGGGTGIGGSSSGSGGTININGGTVTATGSSNSAGIGGGYKYSGGTITITNGSVTAYSGNYSGSGVPPKDIGHGAEYSATDTEPSIRAGTVRHSVMVNNRTGGTITPDKLNGDYNDQITFTITPEYGYAIDEITVTAESGRNIIVTDGSFIMPANNVTVTAAWKIDEHTITVNNSTGGTVTASSTTATVGDTVTLTATPDTGYELDKITVTTDGGSNVTVTGDRYALPNVGGTISGNESQNYTFTMPADNVTVSAEFKSTSDSSGGDSTGGSTGGGSTGGGSTGGDSTGGGSTGGGSTGGGSTGSSGSGGGSSVNEKNKSISSAGETNYKATVTLVTPLISVTIPSSLSAVINPYGVPVSDKSGNYGADGVVSPVYTIRNRTETSAVAVNVQAYLTVPKDKDKNPTIEVCSSPDEVKNKSGKALSAYLLASVSEDSVADAASESKDLIEDNKVKYSAGTVVFADATVEAKSNKGTIMTIPKAVYTEDAKLESYYYGHFKISGEVTDISTGNWDKSDKINLVLVLNIYPCREP